MAADKSNKAKSDDRQDRLAKRLRQNLKRRKGQSRALRQGKADQNSGLPIIDDDTTESHKS